MKRNYLWLIGPWGLFVLLAAGWIAYWHVVAGEAERRLHSWVFEQQDQGAQISLGAIERGGFPVLLRLELRDATFADSRGGWRAQTERIDLHVDLWNTEHVTLEAKAPVSIIRADGGVTTIAAEALIASLRTENGALAQAGLEADHLSLDDPAKDGVLSAEKVVINLRPDPRNAGEYQLAFDAQALNLPRPVRSFESFGQEVAGLRAAIVIEQGPALLQAAPGDPLGPWREAGGQLRFDALALDWGPLRATGNGQGELDAERRLHGELHFPIEEPAPVFEAIARDPGLSEDARSALNLLATAFRLSGDDITLDIDAQDGVMRLEGLSVRTLPPVY